MENNNTSTEMEGFSALTLEDIRTTASKFAKERDWEQVKQHSNHHHAFKIYMFSFIPLVI